MRTAGRSARFCQNESSRAPRRHPIGTSSRLTGYEVCLGAVALVATAVAAVAMVRDASYPGWWALVAIPVVVVMARFPLYLERSQTWLAIGLDAAVLAVLLGVLAPAPALMVWVVASIAAHVGPRSSRYRVFNVTLAVSAGAAATAVVGVADSLGLIATGPPGAVEAAVLLVAFTLFYAIDVGVSELASRRIDGAHGDVGPGVVVRMYVLFCMVVLTAHLGGLIVESAAWWESILLVAPAAIIVVLCRDRIRERETARRLGIVYTTTTALQASDSEQGVLDELEDGLTRISRGRGGGVIRTPPTEPGLTRRPLLTSSDQFWLVLPTDSDVRPALSDSDVLAMLVRGAEESLSRLRLSAQLVQTAERDSLTGLAQRAVFLRQVDGSLRRIRRQGGVCAVLFCDLDGFKRINDWFGHAVGDSALVAFADGVRRRLPEDVAVARLGGDEFAVLVEGDRREGLVRHVISQVHATVEVPFEFSHHAVRISASVGVAYSTGEHTADQLLRNADIAMYEAKWAGRNRVVEYHPSLGRARVRSLELGERLRHAIDAREISVAYQPLYRADTGEVKGVEALARWYDDGEAVSPEIFVAAAEESDLIVDLGAAVRDRVRDEMPHLRAALGPDATVAINISAMEMRAVEFVDSVRDMLADMGGLSLLLELTEREVVSDDVLSSTIMQQLLDLGVGFCVDDFGIGFSSIGYLKQLPVAELKTDRVFSANIEHDPRSAQLLQSMISMGMALGMSVTIEGIERESQLAALGGLLGPDGGRLHLQGYLLGRPMDVSALGGWLASGATGLRARVPREAARGVVNGTGAVSTRAAPSGAVPPAARL